MIKYDEWQDGVGMWHCGNVSDVAHGSNDWWLPARYLGITPCDFAKLLVEKFHVDMIDYLTKYNNIGVLTYAWKKQSDMRVFKNWLNKEIRARKIS